jgi:hypothetical protein
MRDLLKSANESHIEYFSKIGNVKELELLGVPVFLCFIYGGTTTLNNIFLEGILSEKENRNA